MYTLAAGWCLNLKGSKEVIMRTIHGTEMMKPKRTTDTEILLLFSIFSKRSYPWSFPPRQFLASAWNWLALATVQYSYFITMMADRDRYKEDGSVRIVSTFPLKLKKTLGTSQADRSQKLQTLSFWLYPVQTKQNTKTQFSTTPSVYAYLKPCKRVIFKPCYLKKPGVQWNASVNLY